MTLHGLLFLTGEEVVQFNEGQVGFFGGTHQVRDWGLLGSAVASAEFAAYYQPWICLPIDGQLRALPPSGFIAGIYARVDNARGVWKAPANVTSTVL